jgi:sporulation protein YlmC with PRC-barrel domain
VRLVSDVLDQQLIDCRKRKSGKVDGIALEVREGEPPRVAYLDMGIHVLARRLSRRLERLMQRWSQGFEVPWSKVQKVDISVTLTIDVTDYSAFRFENWLREHIIRHIPGNAHEKHQEKHS